MHERSIILGLDVHKETIAVARCDRGWAEAQSLGTIENTPQAVAKLIRKVGEASEIAACYEAGPCGYGLHRQLEGLGVASTVVAPSTVPKAPGKRVKTDRLDAEHLARMHRNGELTAAWVPDADHEAIRDVVRAREQARQDLQRSRQRVGKYLLKAGRRPPARERSWTVKHRRWLDKQHFAHPAQTMVYAELLQSMDIAKQRQQRLEQECIAQMQASPLNTLWWAYQAMRGASAVTASTLVGELGDCSQFPTPRHLMAYVGVTPQEHSSGSRQHRGRITKTGNSAVRRIVIEMAWHYAKPPHLGPMLRRRQQHASQQVCAIAWKAQQRGNARFTRLTRQGKPRPQAVVAVARELLGFIWEIAQVVREEGVTTA